MYSHSQSSFSLMLSITLPQDCPEWGGGISTFLHVVVTLVSLSVCSCLLVFICGRGWHWLPWAPDATLLGLTRGTGGRESDCVWRASVLARQLSVFLCTSVCVCFWALPAVTDGIVPRHWALALFPQLRPLWIRNTTAVLCVCWCVGLYVCGHVHSLAAWMFVYLGDVAEGVRGLGTVCQPSFSLSTYPGCRPTLCSVTVLCWKAAEWNEFTFAEMFLWNIHMLRKASQLLVCLCGFYLKTYRIISPNFVYNWLIN